MASFFCRLPTRGCASDNANDRDPQLVGVDPLTWKLWEAPRPFVRSRPPTSGPEAPWVDVPQPARVRVSDLVAPIELPTDG